MEQYWNTAGMQFIRRSSCLARCLDEQSTFGENASVGRLGGFCKKRRESVVVILDLTRNGITCRNMILYASIVSERPRFDLKLQLYIIRLLAYCILVARTFTAAMEGRYHYPNPNPKVSRRANLNFYTLSLVLNIATSKTEMIAMFRRLLNGTTNRSVARLAFYGVSLNPKSEASFSYKNSVLPYCNSLHQCLVEQIASRTLCRFLDHAVLRVLDVSTSFMVSQRSVCLKAATFQSI